MIDAKSAPVENVLDVVFRRMIQESIMEVVNSRLKEFFESFHSILKEELKEEILKNINDKVADFVVDRLSIFVATLLDEDLNYVKKAMEVKNNGRPLMRSNAKKKRA